MNRETEKQINEILKSGSIGYAYLLDAKAGKTQEKVVSLQPENLAALIQKYGAEMEWMSVTDMRDRMVLRAASGKISSCKDGELRREIEQHLTALLSAEEKATEVLEVDKKAADQYLGEEDQAVTQAEYGMWI